MNKREFADGLCERLEKLSVNDFEGHIAFYSEMIDDRIEEGLTEEDAVLAVGSIDVIAEQIAAEIAREKEENSKTKDKNTENTKNTKKKKKRLGALEITLLAVGSPLWIVLIAVAAVLLAAYYVIVWSLIAVAWSVFGALCGGVLGGIACGVLMIIFTDVMAGVAMIGAATVCAGLGLFAFFGCHYATKGAVALTKLSARLIKKCFKGKEEKR